MNDVLLKEQQVCLDSADVRHLGVNLHLGKKVRPNTP